MVDDQGQETAQKPIWVEDWREPLDGQERCDQGDHTWAAVFYESGRLALWRCEVCGLADREIERLHERLDEPSGWIKFPPRLVAQGSHPPEGVRRWATTSGTILHEGDPSSITFVGVPIPALPEAHAYVERDEHGDIVATYEPIHERDSPYGNHYTLTRYQVVDTQLVRFVSFCFEESTYDTPFAGEPVQSVVLSGLSPLRPSRPNRNEP